MPSNQKFRETDFVLERGVIYEDCEFDSIDFSHLSLKSCSFIDCVFQSCSLANVELLSGSIRNCIFKSSNLQLFVFIVRNSF